MTTEITATLENWTRCEGCMGKWFVHYHGAIIRDSKSRFETGERVRTSEVVAGPDEHGIIKTKNSVYRLDPAPMRDPG